MPTPYWWMRHVGVSAVAKQMTVGLWYVHCGDIHKSWPKDIYILYIQIYKVLQYLLATTCCVSWWAVSSWSSTTTSSSTTSSAWTSSPALYPLTQASTSSPSTQTSSRSQTLTGFFPVPLLPPSSFSRISGKYLVISEATNHATLFRLALGVRNLWKYVKITGDT